MKIEVLWMVLNFLSIPSDPDGSPAFCYGVILPRPRIHRRKYPKFLVLPAICSATVGNSIIEAHLLRKNEGLFIRSSNTSASTNLDNRPENKK